MNDDRLRDYVSWRTVRDALVLIACLAVVVYSVLAVFGGFQP